MLWVLAQQSIRFCAWQQRHSDVHGANPYAASAAIRRTTQTRRIVAL
jgi:hypothetical protein